MQDYNGVIKTVLKEKQIIASANSMVSIWSSWFKGYVRNFHSYEVYNGLRYVKKNKKTMKLAKRVCEDWAGLLWNEKVQITTPNKNDQEVFKYYDLQGKGNKAVELGFALSMSALVVNMDIAYNDNDMSSGKISLDYYNAKNIIPITFKNNEITECAFITHNTNSDVIAIHTLGADGNYVINRFELDTRGSLIDGSGSTLNTETSLPLFTIIYPNIVNNIDIDSPYPISVFANAIDAMMTADDVFDSYDNEFVSGRKRIFISAKMASTDTTTGVRHNTFDPNDVTIYAIPEAASAPGANNQPLIDVKNGDALRSSEHQIGIQDCLNIVSQLVGLGSGYYKFDQNKMMTATQVISEKSDTFKNIKKHELVLDKCIRQIVRALLFANAKWSTDSTAPKNEYTDNAIIDVAFDDSIIEDKDACMTRDRIDISTGIMSPIEFRVKYYGENEQQATDALKKYYGDVSLKNRINSFLTALTTGAMTAEQYVRNVFTDIKDENEIAVLTVQISEAIKSGGSVSADDILGAGGV